MDSWKYKCGLLLMIVVLFTWVTSSEVVQGVFRTYNHPFAVTYLGTSLLVVYLPLSFFTNWLLNLFRSRSYKGNSDNDVDADQFSKKVESGVHRSLSAVDKECAINISICAKDEAGNRSDSECEDKVEILKQEGKLSPKQVVAVGFCIAPIWFITEYLTNAALSRTSVATTTLLASTSGLFTLVISALVGQDKINLVKIISVIVSMAGVAMTTLGNTWLPNQSQSTTSNNRRHSLQGDLFAILSSISYGLFTVLLKKFSGDNGERVDMQRLFGCIGLFSLVAFWWLPWPLTAMGIEPKFSFPNSPKLTEIILINGFVGNFIADYLWALGVVWTSPLVASLGVSLTIPLAMLEDMFIHGQQYSPIYVIGSAQVFLGFVIANLADWISEKLKGSS